jgi:hypothetical protein
MFGVNLAFPDGLFVLQADNSFGKSTCMQAVLYALGLEGMLGPSHEVPLPHVAKDYLEYEGRNISVLESEVLLEVANDKDDRLTLQRQVVGEKDRHLITVWYGAALTQPDQQFRSGSFFVRERGSATREAGFHFQLAKFIGWQIPEVTTYDEKSTPLYMETIFPLLFVEQKHGWSSLRGRFPTHYRIRDVNKRAVEFILKLDAFEIAAEKIALQQQMTELRARWRSTVAEAHRVAKQVNGIIDGVPAEPVSTWPPAVPPRVLVPIGEKWASLADAAENERERLAALASEPVPQVDAVAPELEDDLRHSQEELDSLEVTLRSTFELLQNGRVQVSRIQERLQAVEEDLQRNKDVSRLSKLGGFNELHVATGHCPTCHQEVADSLLTQGAEPMTVESNIAFLEQQRRVFRSMLSADGRIQEAREQQVLGLGARANEVRERIRALKTTLVSDGRLPSYAAVEERVRAEDRVRQMMTTLRTVNEILAELAQLSEEWALREERRKLLPVGDLSLTDEDKLVAWEKLFISQTSQYGVTSVDPSSITISRDTYAPVNEGFDLQFDLSASDGIRLVWAYVLSLLELARTADTNHPGLLILDEPRQQSTKGKSMQEFLKRASHAADSGQQVVVATSEEEPLLRSYLAGVTHTYKTFPQKIIAPL